jgi:uncharacterized protein (DUF58 family)
VQFSEELLRAVSQLELSARRRVAALLNGNYRSAFRGSGMQFKEFRHYEPGDDIRHMSWPVTARTGRATVKVFEEERELDVVLLIDVSGSSLFGIGKKRKIDMYADLAALIGLAGVRSGDNVGALFFNDKAGLYLPPARSRSQVLVTLTHLLNQPLRDQQSDLRPALLQAESVLRNRSLILVLSDFLVPEFEQELRLLSRRHEVILLHCFDDAERGMGLKGVFEVRDPETGEYWLLDGNSPSTRRQLAEFQVRLTHRLEDVSRKARADYVCLSSKDDYLQRLVQYFRGRGPARV